MQPMTPEEQAAREASHQQTAEAHRAQRAKAELDRVLALWQGQRIAQIGNGLFVKTGNGRKKGKRK
jgi:hypothetical protein